MNEPVRAGAVLIGLERKRQIIDEGWDAVHDENHLWGELATVGGLFALRAADPEGCGPREVYRLEQDSDEHPEEESFCFSEMWPPSWLEEYDGRAEPIADEKARLRLLVKAGALIAAEIDRWLSGCLREDAGEMLAFLMWRASPGREQK